MTVTMRIIPGGVETKREMPKIGGTIVNGKKMKSQCGNVLMILDKMTPMEIHLEITIMMVLTLFGTISSMLLPILNHIKCQFHTIRV